MLTFRIANKKDLDQLFVVMKSTGYIGAFYSGSDEEIKVQLANNFFDKKKLLTIVVCEDDGMMVGYSIFGPYDLYKKPEFPEEKDNFAYSKGTGIHKSQQGKKLGTLLREQTDAFAKSLGFKGMYTDVLISNEPSIRVQEKNSYEKIIEFGKPKRILFKKNFGKHYSLAY